jgi:spore coat protein CotH
MLSHPLRLFSSLILALVLANVSAQDLYDTSRIQEIKITFGFNNWDALMDAAIATTEDFTIAKTVEINGVTFDSVGVKYKGNSSYSASKAKNPLHIELNTIKSKQDYEGITDLKLSNGFSDPSFVREVLSYWILSHYMHCPRANFAKVYINGNYYGLMTNVESITKSFLSDHFSSSQGALVKCNPVGGAGPGGGSGSPTLQWLGTDSTKYQKAYEIKSDAGWGELVNMIDTLNNKTDAADLIIDIDRALWMLAYDNLLVNLDSYIGALSQNYYLYRGINRRFNSIVWDLNMSFGGFPSLASSGGGGNLDSIGMQNLSPLAVSTNTQRPLIKKLLENPTYKRMYLAHIRTMLNEMFVSGIYLNKALEQQAIIDTAVQTDVNKFYTYAQFHKNLYWGVSGNGGGPGGGGFGNPPGIVSLINGRINYLMSVPEINAVPPAISAVTTTPSPALGTAVWITAKISGDQTATLLGWRGNTTDAFIRVAMFDDGQHHDGLAGDSIFGASFIANTPITEYYIYAENNTAGAFLPARAEHEYFRLETTLSMPNSGDLVINEILADNINGVTDPAGEHEDWIELFNNTDTEINLTGLYLSDKADNSSKWQFPNDTHIAANGYLTVWADEDGSQDGLHANFKLKAGGEFISLTSNSGNVLDSLSFGQQESDRSFGRYPNGTGNFTDMPTTFSAENVLTTAVSNLFAQVDEIQVFPNPASDLVRVSVAQNPGDVEIRLMNTCGVILRSWQLQSFAGTEVSVSDLPSGIYYLMAFTGGKLFAHEKLAIR